MDTGYYTIKLTVSPLGDGRYRSRIEPQSPGGANSGAGYDFKLDVNAGSGSVPSVAEFTRLLSVGSVSKSTVEVFGRWLFQLVFQGTVVEKYAELKGNARTRNAMLRICVALHSPELINIPWEFLHDGTNFLVRHGYHVVRVLDELMGGKSSFAPIQKVLIATANPKNGYDAFDASGHVQSITGYLKANDLHFEVLEHASRDGLLDKARSKGFDALYFLGHGEASEQGGRLICEGENSSPDPLDASDLAELLRGADTPRFVYLNSCSTAIAAAENPFQGVAQRLMLDGDVAAAAAMQVDVRQRAAMDIAEAFFHHLKDKPEEAMHGARMAAKDGFSFGVPVLYTYLDAPDQYERNCLESLLSSGPESKYALILPAFRLGRPINDAELDDVPEDGRYRFAGETFAREDVASALDVIKLLSRIAPLDQIITSPPEEMPTDCSHYFLFGSRSNELVDAVQKEFSKNFSFDFKPTEWRIIDKQFNKEYPVTAPHTLTMKDYHKRTDYGVIQKLSADQRTYFLLAGLGSRATRGCGAYLYSHWHEHVTREDFIILLRFPAGIDFGQARVIDRATGEPRSPET